MEVRTLHTKPMFGGNQKETVDFTPYSHEHARVYADSIHAHAKPECAKLRQEATCATTLNSSHNRQNPCFYHLAFTKLHKEEPTDVHGKRWVSQKVRWLLRDVIFDITKTVSTLRILLVLCYM